MDGEELRPSEGQVHIDEQKLVLKNVGKSMSGQYVCSASNAEGDGFSKPLLISVNYKPVCVAPTIEYRGQVRSRLYFPNDNSKRVKLLVHYPFNEC